MVCPVASGWVYDYTLTPGFHPVTHTVLCWATEAAKGGLEMAHYKEWDMWRREEGSLSSITTTTSDKTKLKPRPHLPS